MQENLHFQSVSHPNEIEMMAIMITVVVQKRRKELLTGPLGTQRNK